jgi:hypothetical protein
MNWPPVWVLFATFKRTETALRTIESLGRHLHYPNLHFHICDDGSGETDDGTGRWHVGVLADEFSKFHPEVSWHEMDTAPGTFNTGGNINKGILEARERGVSIHMLVFDDWTLLEDLDIRPMVDILDTHRQVGFIRLSYLVPGLSGVCTRYDSSRLGQPYLWLRLIRRWSMYNSWKREAFLVSTQPYIAHLRFFNAYGWHPEHVSPGEAEMWLGYQYNYHRSDENGPQVLSFIGPCTTHAPWGHMVARAHDYAEQFGQA